jgi:hypothetical protein
VDLAGSVLHESGPWPKPLARDDIADGVAACLTPSSGFVLVRIAGAPPDASIGVRIDGAAVASARRLAVAPGPHTLALASPGRAPFASSIDVVAGRVLVVDAALPPAPLPAAPATAATAATAAKSAAAPATSLAATASAPPVTAVVPAPSQLNAGVPVAVAAGVLGLAGVVAGAGAWLDSAALDDDGGSLAARTSTWNQGRALLAAAGVAGAAAVAAGVVAAVVWTN